MLPGEGRHWQVCGDALHPAGSPLRVRRVTHCNPTNPLGVKLYLQKAAEGKHQNKPTSVVLFVCLSIIKSTPVLSPSLLLLSGCLLHPPSVSAPLTSTCNNTPALWLRPTQPKASTGCRGSSPSNWHPVASFHDVPLPP